MRDGLELHFLHDHVAMGLDCTFGAAKRTGGMLVRVADNDKVEDLSFARRQCRKTGMSYIRLDL